MKEIISINGRNYTVIHKVACQGGFIAEALGVRGAIKTVCNFGRGWKIVS